MSLSIEQFKNHQITQSDFEKEYFYKTDLQKICRSLKLNTSGTKYDLNQRIIKYLNHETQTSIINTKNKVINSDLTLDSKIIDGVRLNQKLRDFMSKYYRTDSFKFSKEMAVIIRNARTDNNPDITIQSLIDINDGKIKVNTQKDDVSYQWNQFVKDFCADPDTNKFSNKLSTAASLWNIVKSKADKKYSNSLLKYLP
ncbi:SAP domain-containing protein [Companilactobacillus huachuanensis]|uniref:SAP domain-containing protein n=1 Tax=Companilactobacillus huachuanensis TaxID=2559914 RepID=A0ABW1RM48_9LACO|nr:SAP domain-containing protein [Companilactobacillus huachuanensis]